VGGEISEQYAKCIIEQADARRPIRGADALGRYLRLSDKLRTELGIKTIGSFDVSKQQRARRRKEQRRAYDEKRRRMRGAKPHVQSTMRMKPWEREKISRRTWYYRQKQNQADAQKNGQSSLSPFAQKNGQSAFTGLSVNLCK
jgi:hypothetical protein